MAVRKRRPRLPLRPRLPVDVRKLAADFVRWQSETGHVDVCDLPGLIRVERAQAAQGVVLASDAAKARIAGGAS